MPNYTISALKNFEGMSFDTEAEARAWALAELAKLQPESFFLKVNTHYSEEEQEQIQLEKQNRCSHFDISLQGYCNECDLLVSRERYNSWYGLDTSDDSDKEWDKEDFICDLKTFKQRGFDGILTPTVCISSQKIKHNDFSEYNIFTNGLESFYVENMLDKFILEQLNKGEWSYNLNEDTNDYIGEFLFECEDELHSGLKGITDPEQAQEVVSKVFNEWLKLIELDI